MQHMQPTMSRSRTFTSSWADTGGSSTSSNSDDGDEDRARYTPDRTCWRLRNVCYQLAVSRPLDDFTMGAILLNAVIMALQWYVEGRGAS